MLTRTIRAIFPLALLAGLSFTVRRYHRWTDIARLLLYCLAEHFPYRQTNMWRRLMGMCQYLRGNVAWEKSERTAFAAITK